ncbi:helix-turn-helix domain-containing protein [Brevibacillus reuszeri]|uniref:helix-turn-helix domain-containing protein n=1 Tax=Brevibacillus reuszeri TaxID=54915 RepID=UPI00289F9B0D|nr:helix-turn-helix domain-containing protein [Brevibacillus reuszeri]
MLPNTSIQIGHDRFPAASYHIWTATAHHHWSYFQDHIAAGFEQLTDEPACDDWSWPHPQSLTHFSYSTQFDREKGCQLFLFTTENPELIPVRALLYCDEPQDRSICDLFVLHVRYTLLQQAFHSQWQEHEQWLQGLRSLTSSLDVDVLLLHIMKNAMQAIPTVDRGFLMLYDAETNLLIPKASVGMGSQIYDFKAAIGEGITGKVFQAGVGRIFDREQAREAMKNIRPENMAHLIEASVADDVVFDQPIVMAVPVTMNEEQLGVMIVHQIKAKRQLTWQDLRRLQGLADLAAIAIYNAHLYTEQRRANEYLVKRSQIHEIFIQLSLEEADLGTITSTTCSMVGMPTALVDLTQNQWYPAQSEIETHFSSFSLFSSWERNGCPREVTLPTGDCYHLFPIAGGGITLGCFVVELLRPMEQLDMVVLEQAGAIVALEMINTHSRTELGYKKSFEFYNDLLLFREPADLVARAKEFGLFAKQPLFVVLIQMSNSLQNPKQKEACHRRLIAGLHTTLGSRSGLLFSFHEKITLVLHADSSLKQNHLLQKISTAIERWETEDTPVLQIGVGSLYPGLEHTVKSAEEANKSLTFLHNRNKPGMIRYEEIGINRLFLSQPPEEIERFINEILTPLRSSKAQASELEQTVKEYIAANRSTSLTAERLHIHPNTLYHRLRKIEEILHIDLDDPDDWLKLYLACHLSQTY